MSKARQRAVAGYVKTIRDKLLLSHWTVRLIEEQPEAEAWASVEGVANRYIVNLRVSPDTFDEPPARVRVVFLHEVLHITLMFVFDAPVKTELGQNAFDTFTEAYKRELEYEIDLLTEALAPLFPMPPKWPK